MISKKISAYDDIADMYDMAMKFGHYDFSLNAAPNIVDFIKKRDIYNTNKNLLDLGCGNGLISLLFRKSGFNVKGIDLSEGMIRNAIQNLQKSEYNDIEFAVGDATNFSVDVKFGTIVSLFNVVNHFDNQDALEQCFTCVYNSLENDGYFIFDIFTTNTLENLEPVKVKEYNYNNNNIFFIRELKENTSSNKVETNVTCFFKDGDSKYFKKYTNNLIFEKLHVRTVLNILTKCGFSEMEVLNADNLEPIQNEFEKNKQVFIRAKK